VMEEKDEILILSIGSQRNKLKGFAVYPGSVLLADDTAQSFTGDMPSLIHFESNIPTDSHPAVTKSIPFFLAHALQNNRFRHSSLLVKEPERRP